jgi:hypothetical protein
MGVFIGNEMREMSAGCTCGCVWSVKEGVGNCAGHLLKRTWTVGDSIQTNVRNRYCEDDILVKLRAFFITG